MSPLRQQTKQALLIAVWLAVVIGSLVLAIARFREMGVWGIAAVVIGAGMLALFVIDKSWHKRPVKSSSSPQAGDRVTFVIILTILCALWISAVASAWRRQWRAAVVFAVFAFAFTRIFSEYRTHLKTKYSSRRPR